MRLEISWQENVIDNSWASGAVSGKQIADVHVEAAGNSLEHINGRRVLARLDETFRTTIALALTYVMV